MALQSALFIVLIVFASMNSVFVLSFRTARPLPSLFGRSFLSMADSSATADGRINKLPVEESSGRLLKTSISHSEIGSFVSKMFRSPPSVGAGLDERFALYSSDSDLDRDARTLSKLDMAYAQMGLQTTLMSEDVGLAAKMSYASSAASISKEWSPMQTHAGGLMNDWTFNME